MEWNSNGKCTTVRSIGAGGTLGVGIKAAGMKLALSNHLWLSWKLDNRGGGCVCSTADGPDEDDIERHRVWEN